MFAERLKKLRKSKKITQEKLADIIGVERSSIGKYESPSKPVIPSTDIQIKLADYFDVTVDYLLGREEKPPEKTDDLSDKIIEMFRHLDENQQQKVIEYTRFVLSLDDDKQNS